VTTGQPELRDSGRLDLAGSRSVSIWCNRFSVSFGAAELTPV
jgi:hypothetical protein